jgi:hypothetical protein
MTIDELFEQETEAKNITILEKNTGKELCQQECGDAECDWDWTVDEHGNYTDDIVAKVQEEKIIKYVHVSAPAPQYAINSISRIAGAISYAATQLGIYARTESSRHSIPVDIILIPDVTDEQAAELLQKAKEDMEDDGYTGVDADGNGLTYDAGIASIEDAEPSRNW